MANEQFASTAAILNITPERARLVHGYLLVQYGRTSQLSREQIRFEYGQGGISDCIDLDLSAAEELAVSFGL